MLYAHSRDKRNILCKFLVWHNHHTGDTYSNVQSTCPGVVEENGVMWVRTKLELDLYSGRNQSGTGLDVARTSEEALVIDICNLTSPQNGS